MNAHQRRVKLRARRRYLAAIRKRLDGARAARNNVGCVIIDDPFSASSWSTAKREAIARWYGNLVPVGRLPEQPEGAKS